MAYTYGGKSVKAWHTNYPKFASLPFPFPSPTYVHPRGAPPTFTSGPLRWLSYMLTPYTPAEKAGLERTAWAAKWTKGYSAEQTTRPQTLGYALTDSPVGLLAWIYEKMVEWTDAYPWTDDEGRGSHSSSSHTKLMIVPLNSADLGIDILVLTCGAGSDATHILRGDERRGERRYNGCAQCAAGRLVLPT